MTHSSALVVDDRLKGLVPFLPLNLPAPAAPRPAAPGAAIDRRIPRTIPGGTPMSRVTIAHCLAGGAVRSGELVAVHRRSDRAGADHPVRPARPGDRASGTATKTSLHPDGDPLRQAAAQSGTAGRAGHPGRPAAAGGGQLHPVPHHRPAAVLSVGRSGGGWHPRPAQFYRLGDRCGGCWPTTSYSTCCRPGAIRSWQRSAIR